MSKKGRKPILTETEAKSIVNSYVLKYGVSKEIKYIEIHNFCVEQYENQKISKVPSESFWRKKDRIGRKLIDEVNSALTHQVKKQDKNYDIQNILDFIDIKISNKELKTALFNTIKSKQTKIEQLEKELIIKEESILSLKESREKLKKVNKQQQDLISQTFHYFLNKSSEENLAFFDSALNNIFAKPLDFLELLKEEKNHNKNNVADFFKNRLNDSN